MAHSKNNADWKILHHLFTKKFNGGNWDMEQMGGRPEREKLLIEKE